MTSRKESKLRSKRFHEMQTRFQKTQKGLTASTSATRPTTSSASPSGTSAADASNPSVGSPGTQASPPPTKRVITMSQLRKAAVHASLTSPIKRLAVASPLAKRIRQEILKSGETQSLETCRSAEKTPRSSASRRQRLQESRFRVHPSIPSTVASLASSFCSSHNTPLARNSSFFFSSPSQTRLLVNLQTSASTSSNKGTVPATENTSKLAPPVHRSIAARSPLEALFAASNRSPTVPLGNARSSKQSPILVSDGDDSSTTRSNLDKRTARILHGPAFQAMIAKLRQIAPPISPSVNTDRSVPERAATSVTVVIRKRPMFPQELGRGDFDVVATHGSSCTIYKTAMEADMKTRTVTPVVFPCTATFGEANSTRDVFEGVLAPLLHPCFCQPSSLTLLMFGQTGSGKSYTIAGIERELLYTVPYPLSLQSLEISGKICRDLLLDDEDSKNQKNAIRIVDHGVNSVVGAQPIPVQSPEQLAQLLATIKSRRATCATDKNHESSRSHVLCNLSFPSGGSVTLVDCAGTERKNDSLHHCKHRRAESAEINMSLYALKECIRARASTSAASHSASSHIPYRSSTLTRVLRPYLDGPLVVVATVAPNATDTEHTLHTLETVLTLTGLSAITGAKHSALQPRPLSTGPSQQPRLVSPKRWTHEQLREFLQRKHLLGSVALPSTLNGAQVMRFNKLQMVHLLHFDPADADKIFHLLRAETSRIDRLELKKRLQQKRASIGA